MGFHPIRTFKDPSSRPRAVIWSGVALIIFVIVWAVGLDGTSTYWFCTQPCHIVHDDNTLAYNQSTHSRVACVACHEPVNTNPLHLTLLKIEVAPDAIDTIGRTFQLPMNAEDHVAIEMPSEQCTQCHNLGNRPVTPHHGIVINHDKHAKKDIQCTLCHNRVAHPEENITLVLAGDRKHDNWMKMDACFRCHKQDRESDKTPPGACVFCHTLDYDLVPASHDASGWYELYGESGEHAKAAMDESKTVDAALKRMTEDTSETAEEASEESGEEELPPSSAINSCYTCHRSSFCADCHGVEIPHTEAFKKDHAKKAFADPAVCAKCHARTAAEARGGTGFCNACHHPQNKPGTSWIGGHPGFVKKDGAEKCFDCHVEEQCSFCHVNGIKKYRASRKELYGK